MTTREPEIYDFDHIPDRRGTSCLKYDFARERGKPEGVLPLWVADMDFPAPPAVRERIHALADHGVFGYSEGKRDYFDAVAGWFHRHHHWDVAPEWLVKTPGVVMALALSIRALTAPGDAVLLLTPVYYPFHEVIRDNGRRIVESPLIYAHGRYDIDFADMEEKIAREQVRLLLLCSPHNPMGRVWTREELRRMGEICLRHGVLVVSDEIHCDFAFPEHPHTVFPVAVPEMAERCIVCTAATKTFNLAGLQVSNIFIPGEEVRRRFHHEVDACGYSQPNLMGIAATQAAYEHGDAWLRQCRDYLRGNLDFFRSYLAEHLPELKLVEPDGTYFAWVDCSGLGLSQEALDELVLHRAGLWLDPGHIFGAGSGQFQRFVLATNRETVGRALERLEGAIRACFLR